RPAAAAASTGSFLGRWDLTLKAPDREHASWLEIRREGSALKARMVGRWGNARDLPRLEIKLNHITFVSPKEEEGLQEDMVFEGELTGNMLSGSISGPKGGMWTWTGKKAPALARSAPPRWGAPISLFNGKDLTGWKAADPAAANTWRVVNGTLVSPERGTDIITTSKFEDFKLHVEFNCAADSNSGVYLRGRYEVQIETDSPQEPPNRRMGSVYGFMAPVPEPPRKPGEWQSYDITLIGRMITVVMNGTTIIDKQEIPGITGGALDSHEELPGPIYLQGGENGHVAFRNISITPAKP
ncbi:MAG TPA: DUF1080 domain-containing protein, partial [Acidobacteriota bacterium]|nr:DUF1080 domain-containing protein [Acidobacteriota bacterium]